MQHKPFFIIHILIFLIFFNTSINAEQLKVLPLKKPVLEKTVIKKIIQQGILKPKPKPNNEKKKEEKKVIVETPKKEKKTTTKNKIGLLLPKKKPLVVKKNTTKAKKKSKYFRQKDYIIAKQAVKEIEKRKWSKALSIAKKAKDKSIYNFIQWRHLLTKGNTASFYD